MNLSNPEPVVDGVDEVGLLLLEVLDGALFVDVRQGVASRCFKGLLQYLYIIVAVVRHIDAGLLLHGGILEERFLSLIQPVRNFAQRALMEGGTLQDGVDGV